MALSSSQTLAFIGDSLTEYFDWAARFPACNVMNLGISGETAEELLARTGRIFSFVKEPDVVFLMTGTNNVAMENYGIDRTCRKILELFTANYKNSVIVVQSIPPMELSWVDTRAIPEVNRKLNALASEFSVKFLDVYRLFFNADRILQKGLLLPDGVHLSDRGYKKWSAAVEIFLNEFNLPEKVRD